ncbi:hypothetical protein RRG08_027052 [Elysia crispata]|uniref:Uncharacterized protein n=1 Tax=Elysia crispata TaxID=231223 RepID=A0AAE0ZJA6_9GAST|nr:hypothetical protein RRG08_027052 [Elysia crispata]
MVFTLSNISPFIDACVPRASVLGGHDVKHSGGTSRHHKTAERFSPARLAIILELARQIWREQEQHRHAPRAFLEYSERAKRRLKDPV